MRKKLTWWGMICIICFFSVVLLRQQEQAEGMIMRLQQTEDKPDVDYLCYGDDLYGRAMPSKSNDLRTVLEQGGRYLGKIKRSNCSNREAMKSFDASVLPVGTRLYQVHFSGSDFWILAKYRSWMGVYIRNPFLEQTEIRMEK